MRVPPMLHARAAVILLLTPPVLGMVLGGILAHVVAGARETPEDRSVTLWIAVVTSALLAAFVVHAVRVMRGAQTDFPRLVRAAPLTALVALALGVLVASNERAARERDEARRRPMTSAEP